MEEIYNTPNSEVLKSPNLNFPVWKKIICTILILPPAILYIFGYKTIPQFFETFANFGVELPFETLLVLQLQPYLVWFSVASFTPLIIWHKGITKPKFKSIIFSISVFHFVIGIIGFVFLQWALYAPIFAMK